MPRARLGKHYENCTEYRALLRSRSASRKANDMQGRAKKSDKKKVYYFSLEFLIGPLLDNYLLNFGIRDIVEEGCAELGTTLDDLIACEADPGLGNGGLGRLAACFLDSMAHNGIAGYGNGMRYRYGLFRQEIEGGRQVEKTDNWLSHGYPWETRAIESAVVVQFRRPGRAPRGRERQVLVHLGGRREGPGRPLRRPHRGLRRGYRQQAAHLERRALLRGLRPRRLQRR